MTPWSAIISGMRKKTCVAPLGLPNRPYIATPFIFSVTHQKSFPLGPGDPAGVPKREKTSGAKRAWNAIVSETANVSGGNSIFSILSPCSRNRDSRPFLLKQKSMRISGKKQLKYVPLPSTMILRSAMISEYICVLNRCAVRWHLWSATTSVECDDFVWCGDFWVCVAGTKTK